MIGSAAERGHRLQLRRSVFWLSLAIALWDVPASLAGVERWVSPVGRACESDRCDCPRTQACEITGELLSALAPGDYLTLLPGKYPALRITGLQGIAGEEIVIRGVSIDGVRAEISGEKRKRRDALEIAESSHLRIENLLVRDAPRAGIRVNNSHHVEVRDSEFRANGLWGIFTNHANHFSATGNTIIGPARQHGIYHSNSGDGVDISSNYIVGFEGAGIHMNGDLRMGGAAGVAPDGIISDVVIRNNYIAGNGTRGGSAINLDGVEKVVIEDNIVVGNHASGLAIFREDGAIGSRNVQFRRNVLVMAPASRWAVTLRNSGGENRFEGNVVIAQNMRRGIYEISDASSRLSGDGELLELPLSANSNYYYYPRLFAALNADLKLGFPLWQRNGQDRDSRLLGYVGRIELAPNYSCALPASVGEAIASLGIAVDNPHRDLLEVAAR